MNSVVRLAHRCANCAPAFSLQAHSADEGRRGRTLGWNSRFAEREHARLHQQDGGGKRRACAPAADRRDGSVGRDPSSAPRGDGDDRPVSRGLDPRRRYVGVAAARAAAPGRDGAHRRSGQRQRHEDRRRAVAGARTQTITARAGRRDRRQLDDGIERAARALDDPADGHAGRREDAAAVDPTRRSPRTSTTWEPSARSCRC